MTAGSPTLSIVLPCYNEGEGLLELMEGYRSARGSRNAELILVDNGSTDESQEILGRELRQPGNDWIRSVRVPVNVGYGHGLFSGLLAAKGEFVAWSHADMQCPPEDVFAAFDLLAGSVTGRSHSLVKGRRAPRSPSSEFVTRGMSFIATTLLCTRLTDINAQPKVFCRDLLRDLPAPPDGFAFDVYVLFRAKRAGWRILEIPVVFGERRHGQSRWSFGFFSRWRTILRTAAYIMALRFRPSGPRYASTWARLQRANQSGSAR